MGGAPCDGTRGSTTHRDFTDVPPALACEYFQDLPAYLGRTVTMDGGNSTVISGEVTAIDTSGDTPQLKVNGTFYSLSALLSVAPTPASNTNTSTAGQPTA